MTAVTKSNIRFRHINYVLFTKQWGGDKFVTILIRQTGHCWLVTRSGEMKENWHHTRASMEERVGRNSDSNHLCSASEGEFLIYPKTQTRAYGHRSSKKCGIPSPEINMRADEQASAEYLLGGLLVVRGNVWFHILLPVLSLHAHSSLSPRRLVTWTEKIGRAGTQPNKHFLMENSTGSPLLGRWQAASRRWGRPRRWGDSAGRNGHKTSASWLTSSNHLETGDPGMWGNRNGGREEGK